MRSSMKIIIESMIKYKKFFIPTEYKLKSFDDVEKVFTFYTRHPIPSIPIVWENDDEIILIDRRNPFRCRCVEKYYRWQEDIVWEKNDSGMIRY